MWNSLGVKLNFHEILLGYTHNLPYGYGVCSLLHTQMDGGGGEMG